MIIKCTVNTYVSAIDSTFIKTLINGSGSYKGMADVIKIHIPAIVFLFAVPLNAYLSSKCK